MGFGDNRWQYTTPPTTTELVVTGCNVQVTVLFTASSGTYGYTTGCCSHCSGNDVLTADDVRNNYMIGYCTTPVFSYLAYYTVELKASSGSPGTAPSTTICPCTRSSPRKVGLVRTGPLIL